MSLETATTGQHAAKQVQAANANDVEMSSPPKDAINDTNSSGFPAAPKPDRSVSQPGTSDSTNAPPSASGNDSSPTATTQASSAAAQQLLTAAQRKQNIACDNCRGRKVRCVRQTGFEKCDHCRAKGTECTSHYVTAASSSRRRPAAASSSTHPSKTDAGASSATKEPIISPSQATGSEELSRAGNHPKQASKRRKAEPRENLLMLNYEPCRSRAGVSGSSSSDKRQTSPSSTSQPYMQPLQPSYLDQLDPPVQSPQDQLLGFLAYMFAPEPVIDPHLKWRDPTRQELINEPIPYAPTFYGQPSKAHLSLKTSVEILDLATDLIDTFFQIVHIRMHLVDQNLVNSQFHNPSANGLPTLPKLACILAWGSKFSEHPTIIKDREESSAGIPGERKRCRLSQVLVRRAANVAGVCGVWRVPSLEHAQVALLLNFLDGANIHDSHVWPANWHAISIAHLKTIRLNRNAGIASLPPHHQALGALTFWLSCWMDGLHGAYYGYPARLLEGDWDLETRNVYSKADGHGDSEGGLIPLLKNDEFWEEALTGLSRVARHMSTYLFLPSSERHGIPFHQLKLTIELLTAWRDEYLAKLGVPTVWPSTWDFMAAVTSCTEDANYHVQWVTLSGAIDNSGIQEIKHGPDSPVKHEAQMLARRIKDEAMHGALRIVALAGVLTQNNYLRLDPNLLLPPIARSGMYLALAGRSECLTCVAALRQYGISFEEAYDRADELEVLYSKRSASLLNKQPPDFLAPSGNVGVSGSSGSGGGSGSSSAPPPLPTPSTFAFTAANTMTAGGGSGSGGSSSGMTSGPNQPMSYPHGPDLSQSGVSPDLYGLADQSGMNEIFYSNGR